MSEKEDPVLDSVTHQCPTCGDVHLPPAHEEMVGQHAPAPHTHTPEERWYNDLAGKRVFRCSGCGARVNANGSEWRPGGAYPWG